MPRRSPLAASSLLPLALACAPPPDPLAIELDEPRVERRPAHPSWQLVPDRPPEPDPPPRLALVEPPEEVVAHVCPYAVVAHHFPAISMDGARIVDVAFDTHDPYGENHEGDYLRLISLEPDRQDIQLVFDHSQERPWEDPSACAKARARARRQVARINRELARTSWRMLTKLDVRDTTKIRPWSLEEEALQAEIEAEVTRLPVSERPLELNFTDGELVIRIRDGQEFLRERHLDWINQDAEYCSKLPVFGPVMIDRQSGAALLRFGYEDLVSCVCSAEQRFARVQLRLGG